MKRKQASNCSVLAKKRRSPRNIKPPKFSAEILEKIFSFCTIETILTCTTVCKEFHRIISAAPFYRLPKFQVQTLALYPEKIVIEHTDHSTAVNLTDAQKNNAKLPRKLKKKIRNYELLTITQLQKKH